MVRLTTGATYAVVEMNRPDAQNQLDDAMMNDLHAALDAADVEKTLVLKGAGSVFSVGRPHHTAGHGGGPEAARRALDAVVRLNLRIAAWKAPTLGLVQGSAHGAATGMLVHCDVVAAERGTEFSFPEITYNLPPGLVASYLARHLGEKAARLLIMTGRPVNAETALQMGLISQVVEAGELGHVEAQLIAFWGDRLEAEIALKENLRAFSPFAGEPEERLRQGVEFVLQWGARHKK